jgi:hypothetical protein
VGVDESPGYARHAAPGHARVGGDVARAPLPKAAQKVAFNPVGQIVGAMNEKLAVRDVIYTLVEEYVDSVDRLQKMQGRAIRVGLAGGRMSRDASDTSLAAVAKPSRPRYAPRRGSTFQRGCSIRASVRSARSSRSPGRSRCGSVSDNGCSPIRDDGRALEGRGTATRRPERAITRLGHLHDRRRVRDPAADAGRPHRRQRAARAFRQRPRRRGGGFPDEIDIEISTNGKSASTR